MCVANSNYVGKDLCLINLNLVKSIFFSYIQVKSENPSKEISDIAAEAEVFQPKGNTLSTTQVSFFSKTVSGSDSTKIT